jgi:two-component sensor histidine kinase
MAAVELSEVYITRELESRQAPELDHRAIKEAIQALAARMIEGPEDVLPRFVEMAMTITGGVSSGISISEPPQNQFRWAYLKGSLAVFEGATTPRDYSPCGVTLDEDRPVLTRHSEEFYSWIADVNVVLPEVLLVPLHRGQDQLGTLWIVSDKLGHFHRSHVAAITELATFVSIALQMSQTEQRLKHSLAEQQSLTAEMSHRVKNVFNITQGMILLGARTVDSKDEFAKALSGRVQALAVAHGIVRRNFTDASGAPQVADLDALVRAILQPYGAAAGEAARHTIAGPPLPTAEHATNGIALVLHELATNAVKYGAWCRPGGSVGVTWQVANDMLELHWVERGGPPISVAPTSSGFGSRLIRDTVQNTLRGTLERQWLREGAEVRMTVPLDALDR